MREAGGLIPRKAFNRRAETVKANICASYRYVRTPGPFDEAE
jgi:hypothetical protein